MKLFKRYGMFTSALTKRLILLTFGLGICGGCYDGEALVNQARSAALNTRLAEVDLGSFRTTLPRDPNSASITELAFHIFGTAPRYRVPAIEKQLKADEYRLRHETLAAVRRSTRDELAEPSLARLRTRIESVMNSVLDDAPVKAIGFYEVTLRDM